MLTAMKNLFLARPQKTAGGGSNEKDAFTQLAVSVGICPLLGEAWPQTQPMTRAKAGFTEPIQITVPSSAGGVIDI
jgi:hypothetical protein